MSEEAEKMIPFHRFEERGAKIKALEAELAEIRGKFDGLAKEAETWKAGAAEAEKWRSEHGKITAQYAEERALASEGITDPEVIEAARWAYGRLPDADRKPFPEVVKAWKEKPSEAPKILQPHLAPPAPAQPPQRPGLPPSSKGTAASPAAPVGQLDARAIATGAQDADLRARLGLKPA